MTAPPIQRRRYSAYAIAAERIRPRPHRWPSPGAMAAALDPAVTVETDALRLLDKLLVDESIRKLMFFMPPQEGKSQRVSRRFPAWLLEQDPTLNIAIVSYELDTAVRWGREIKRDLESHPELGIELQADSRAAGRWETRQGGGVYCVGIGGPLTGRKVDVLIIDDPVKGRAEAESRKYRQAAWDWWESTAQTRFSSRFRVILIMTRWHEDDLAGRLLKAEGSEWTVVRVQPIAKQGDPLGRKPGQEMQSAQRRPPGWFYRLKAKITPYVWHSVYDQTPTAAEGNLFRRRHFRYWNYAPPAPQHLTGPFGGRRLDLAGRLVLLSDCYRFATVDLAASVKTSADFTVASAWAMSPDGDLILLDRARARVEETKHWGLIRPLVERYQLGTVFIEAAWIGTTLVIDAVKAGVPVEPLKADTDKITRAIPAADRIRQHRVWWPAGAPWLDEWTNELAQFPTSEHDDQVDTLSYAARVASAHWLPGQTAQQRRAEQELVGADSREVADAFAAQTGKIANGHPPDFESMAWD